MLTPIAFVIIIAFAALALYLIIRKDKGKEEKR